jgi:hypothetical protein
MLAKVSPAAIICADGGDRHLEAAGVMPDAEAVPDTRFTSSKPSPKRAPVWDSTGMSP